MSVLSPAQRLKLHLPSPDVSWGSGSRFLFQKNGILIFDWRRRPLIRETPHMYVIHQSQQQKNR